MKTFLGVLGFFSLIGSLVALYQWFTIDSTATTIMQQQAGISYLIYSGVMLLAGITGLGFSQEK